MLRLILVDPFAEPFHASGDMRRLVRGFAEYLVCGHDAKRTNGHQQEKNEERMLLKPGDKCELISLGARFPEHLRPSPVGAPAILRHGFRWMWLLSGRDLS